eukprot:TRINITY_DN7250_c0_g1_i1.p1 TRINITY_DN7250_c0_g1~~TRINITY_DN7250_c0_g1_i1.p1  ORF type:complete len:259 (+),score=42.78 TRINITY_DN7250_c0_g1_i1:394-1170(+)
MACFRQPDPDVPKRAISCVVHTDSEAPLVKVCVVGAPRVGKRSIVDRFCMIRGLTYRFTIDVDFTQRHTKVHGNPVDLQIWIAPQRFRFQAISARLFKDCEIVIMVASSIDPASHAELLDLYAHVHSAIQATQDPSNVTFVTILNKMDEYIADGLNPALEQFPRVKRAGRTADLLRNSACNFHHHDNEHGEMMSAAAWSVDWRTVFREHSQLLNVPVCLTSAYSDDGIDEAFEFALENWFQRRQQQQQQPKQSDTVRL